MADDKKKKDSEEEVLDLLSEKKKPSRRERQRQEASKVQSLDDKKAAALDLGIEDDKPKKKSVRKTENSGKEILPAISNKLDVPDAEFIKSEPFAIPETEKEEEENTGSVDGNVISIKPPIIVSDLAEKMGMK